LGAKVSRNRMFATIPVRNVKFSFRKDTPKHWIKDSPFKTHLLNAFSLVFPEGEKYFIRAVARYMRKIKDPQLKANARAFMQQEAQHTMEHQRFFDVMREQGYDIDRLLKIVEYISKKVLENSLSDKMNLSVTAGLEHYTALLSDICLADNFLQDAEGELRELFEWHAAEEVEHKAVCFDVLKSQTDSYAIRIAGMAIATAVLTSYTTVCTTSLLYQDRLLFSPKVLKEVIGVLFTENKLFIKVVINVLQYCRTDFHPDLVDNEGFSISVFQELGLEPTPA
jgi:uncharacterized protein